MDKMKKENPNANWSNLITGFVILVILAVFSVWYFGQNSNLTVPVTSGETVQKGIDEKNAAVQEGENGIVQEGVQEIITQQGEGLWQVAERVCGDPEKYNLLAEQNGLTIWSQVSEGTVLKVNCN